MTNPIKLTKIYLSPIANAWKWLRTTLVLLGLLLIATVSYWSYKGMPNCLRTLDAQMMQESISDLQQAMAQNQQTVTDLVFWQQEQSSKQVRAEKVRVAQR